jgi:uncharacterized lipoprotein YehR (DUF1307 family)
MKKLLLASLVVISLVGCGRIDGVVNTVKSATGQLERKITLYDANGKTIKTWETTNTIEYGGPVAGFVDKNGVNVRISGTFVIEGK